MGNTGLSAAAAQYIPGRCRPGEEGSKGAEAEKRLQQQREREREEMGRAGAEVYEGEFAGFGGVFWESVAFGWDLESTMSKTGVSGTV